MPGQIRFVLFLRRGWMILRAWQEEPGSLAGFFPLGILWFEDQGNQRLEVLVEGPGLPKQLLPPRLLFRK